MWFVQNMVDQVHIVMGVKACDTAVIESSTARSSESFDLSKASVAVIEGDGDSFLYLAVIMPEMSADTLALIFFQPEGTVNPIGLVLARSTVHHWAETYAPVALARAAQGLPP